MTPAAPFRTASAFALALVALHAIPGPVFATSQLPQGQTAEALLVVIRSQYRRLSFAQDIQRIAVADTEILTAELITSREVLILGRETGRTTLIVWFANGFVREFAFAVQRDLSLLERALVRVHPSIQVESAPDRDALVLTGVVPDLTTSLTAEAIARNYLEAGSDRGTAQPLVASPPQPAAGAAAPQAGPAPAASAQLQGPVPTTGAVINLIQLETLPALLEEKVRDAIRAVGGQDVTVRRVLRSNIRDDATDTLVLEGRVPNQTSLVRVLMLAAQLFAGQAISESDIRVLADEAGALADQTQTQSTQQTQLGGGATSSLFGGARGNRLTNQVRTNLARA